MSKNNTKIKPIKHTTISNNITNRSGLYEIGYLNLPAKLPLLTKDEERILLLNIHYNKDDIVSLKKLVIYNMKFVVYIARQFSGYGINLPELIQEGVIGFIKAIKAYNPNYTVKLISFAKIWVQSEIFNYVINNWKLVKVATTKKQRKLFFKLNRITNNELPNNELAKEFGLELKEFKKIQDKLTTNITSIDYNNSDYNQIISSEDQNSNFALSIEEKEWNNEIKKELIEQIKLLDHRSANIIYNRFQAKEKKSLKELSEIHSISIERVRQIESKALIKIRKALKDFINKNL